MAAVTTLNKVSVSLKLNNGTNPTTGALLTKSISLSSLNKTAFNADKVMAIVTALTPCLDKAIVSVNKTEASTLSNGD